MDTNQITNMHERAMQDRNKLVMTVVGMAVLTIISITISYMGVSVFILLPIAVIVFAFGVAVSLRMAKKLEITGFEEGMELALEGVPIDCTIVDEKGTVLHCNDRAAKLFNVSKAVYTKQLFGEFMPEFQPDGSRSLETAGRYIQKAFETGSESFEWQYQLGAGGEKIPCSIDLAAANVYDTKRIIVFNKDLREVYAAQRREAAFKERMHAILDASPIVCAVYDEKGDIVDVNKEAENMFGISNSRQFMDEFSRFMPKHQPDGSDSNTKSHEMLMKAMRDGSVRYEWMYLHSDGSMIPTEEIVQRITVDGKAHAIAYSRDLREYYREREKERVVQGKIQAMMEQLNEHVEAQATSVATSSAATEEMIANIQSVTDTLSKNTENVRELEEASVAGHTSLNEVVADIQGIARESESLLEINAVMQNIASQTNLLSMNAAIEAAHAGESGRGFAVVADEIRKLAESSSKQSKTIGGVLKSIKGSFDKITKSTEVVLGKFNAIGDGVKIVATQEDSILNAMEEQGQGSKQILQAISNVNEVTHQVKEAARRLVETSKETMHKTSDAEYQASTDDVSGARNRDYFFNTGTQELRYCTDENREFNLIMFSIDNLQRVADVHGEDIRGEVLKILCMRVRNSLKQGTLLARYSDDRFIVTLPNVPQGTATKLAEQLMRKIKETPFATKGIKLNVSISIGLAVRTNTSKTIETIINDAGLALTSAQASGSGKIIVAGK